jgi:hypothetical protein
MLLASAAATGAIGLSGRTARAPAGGAEPTPPGPVDAMPSQVVVWTGDRIEVVSSRTGRLIRTLATDEGLYSGLPTLAVSANGVVYFDDARGTREWVRSVPLAGGPVTTIAEGRVPAISPNGRLLAYVTDTDHPTGRDRPQAIIVRDLPAGPQKTWAFTSIDPDINSLSWSPDGRHLAFAGLTFVKNETVAVRFTQVLDTRSGGTLDDARRMRLGQRVAWAGYLTVDTGAAVMLGPHGVIQAGPGSLVEVGVNSGRILRHLTSLPPQGLATANAVDGAEGTIAVDRTGRYLLIAGGAGYSAIFRWTFGMRHPVTVATGAIRAAWAGSGRE